MICRFCNASFDDDPPCGQREGCLARDAPDRHELERELLNAEAREAKMSERLFGDIPRPMCVYLEWDAPAEKIERYRAAGVRVWLEPPPKMRVS